MLYWRDRHLCFACMTSLSHHRASVWTREIDRPDRDLLGTRAIQAEASAPCRYLTVPLPARACPAPCSLGHEQFRDLTGCAGLSPEPGGRDLAGVALADLAMTRPETVRPHQVRNIAAG